MLMLAQLLALGVDSSQFELTMAVTHDIRGAAFPVNMWTGVYCTVQANMSMELCNQDCRGGAARRATVFAEMRAQAAGESNTAFVAVDTGAFGQASTSIRLRPPPCLAFRDFIEDYREKADGLVLASYLEAAGVTAVATNLNISRPAKPNSGQLYLTEQHIAAYTMTSLPFERLNGDGDNDVTDIKLAFLSLTAPHHLPHPYK
eukprot:gene16873-2414_t